MATWGRGDGDDKDKDNNNGCPGPGNSDDRGDDRGNDSNHHHNSSSDDRYIDDHIPNREDYGVMIQNTQQTSTINSDGELYPVARQMTLVRAAYADAIDLPDAYDARPLMEAISQHASNGIEDDSDHHSDFDDSAFVIHSTFVNSDGYDGFDNSDFDNGYDSF